jgi:formylglycine-generating enzyme required for sulfatase activity
MRLTVSPNRVHVDGFWIDETEFTNSKFREFVNATGYVTVAKRPYRLGSTQDTIATRYFEAL